jgi:hypothetical protein
VQVYSRPPGAREYANAGWSVKIADLDIAQKTSFAWQGRRLQAGIEPVIPVERFGTVEQAVISAGHLDLLILDPRRTRPPPRYGSRAPRISSSCRPGFHSMTFNLPYCWRTSW